MIRGRSLLLGIGLVCATLGLGQGVYLEAKAWLAQVLIDRAWDAARDSGQASAPWPWADTHPVARLSAPRLNVSRMVLSGASGRVLAFGPGHVAASARPGDPGVSFIAGHRDTHFHFLKRLHAGDQLLIETQQAKTVSYRVVETWVQDEQDTAYLESLTGDQLILMTCYPFEAVVPGGPLRYLVRAVAEPDTQVDYPAVLMTGSVI